MLPIVPDQYTRITALAKLQLYKPGDSTGHAGNIQQAFCSLLHQA
jgi:hypothetical protein